MSQSSHDVSDRPKSFENNKDGGPASSPSPSSSSSQSKNALKAKSCKGCLYYSSNFKANSRNPLCVGLPRSLPNVPPYLTGQAQTEASKENRSLADFRYACVGYSLYLDRKGQSSSGQDGHTELPACVGLEVLVDRRVNAADSTSDQATPIHNREDGNGLPQRRSPKPAHTTGTGDDFYTRFMRNANVVANGVVKNVRRVGNQIKQTLDDIVNPYRGRPK